MNKHTHAVTYGVAIAISVIAFSLGIYMAEIREPWLNYLGYVIYIAFLVFALKNWRDKGNGGRLTYGQAMGYSTLVALYYSIIMAIWMYVFFAYIAPDYMESEFLRQEMEMEAKGVPPEQIEMGMKYARQFSTPPLIAMFAFLGSMLFTTIINLVVSAVMKKDDHLFRQDNTTFPPPAY
jgi:hypothetical protein